MISTNFDQWRSQKIKIIEYQYIFVNNLDTLLFFGWRYDSNLAASITVSTSISVPRNSLCYKI